MILLGTAILFGVTVSQKMFGALLFWGLAVLLGANLAACTMRQFTRAWFRTRTKEILPISVNKDAHAPCVLTVPDRMSSDKALAISSHTLSRLGYRVVQPADTVLDAGKEQGGTLYGWKGCLGFWGSPLFHLALIIVLIGGILTGIGRTREYVALNEGAAQELTLGRLSFGPAWALNLKQVQLDFDQKGNMADWRAFFELQQGATIRTGVIDGQHNYEDGQFTATIQKNGYSPGLIISRNGQTVEKMRVLLDTRVIPGGYRYEGVFTLPDGTKLNLNFWPNFKWQGQEPDSEGDAPRNPRLSLAAEKGKNTGGKPDVLKQGESTQLNGWTISFDHYKIWLEFLISWDPGYIPVLIGFWLALAGLLLLYMFQPAWISLEIVQNGEKVFAHVALWSYRGKRSAKAETSRVLAALGRDAGLVEVPDQGEVSDQGE